MKTLEVILYLLCLVLISIWGVPYFYSCNEYFSQFIIEHPKSVFSIQVFLLALINLLVLIAPFCFIFFVTVRLLEFPDLLATAFCYAAIAIIYLYVFIYIQIHSFWYDPDIFDVIINPVIKLGASVSSNNLISGIVKLIVLVILNFAIYILPLGFLIALFDKIKHHKYFKVAVSIFFFTVISQLIIEYTYEFSNNLVNEGISFDFQKDYFLTTVALIGLMVLGYCYFYYLAPIVSLLMFMPFLKNKMGDKELLTKLNVYYLIFIFVLNVGVGQFTTLNFPRIPEPFPGEVLKSMEELEYQDEMNDANDDYH